MTPSWPREGGSACLGVTGLHKTSGTNCGPSCPTARRCLEPRGRTPPRSPLAGAWRGSHAPPRPLLHGNDEAPSRTGQPGRMSSRNGFRPGALRSFLPGGSSLTKRSTRAATHAAPAKHRPPLLGKASWWKSLGLRLPTPLDERLSRQATDGGGRAGSTRPRRSRACGRADEPGHPAHSTLAAMLGRGPDVSHFRSGRQFLLPVGGLVAPWSP